MIANLYLMSESFKSNDSIPISEIEVKIKQLAKDIQLINKYSGENKVFTNYQDLFPVKLCENYTIGDIFCNPQISYHSKLSRDVITAFKSITQKSIKTNYTSSEVKEQLLNEENENECHGIIAFNPIDGIENEKQLIYGKESWYKFRRYYLGKYPQNKNYFIDECKKYFPNLFFHERNKLMISSILRDCSNKIVFYLGELNDKFNKSKSDPYTRVNTIIRFNSEANFDQDASIENGDKRKNLSWKFNSTSGEKTVYCEIHLKLLKNDLGVISQDRRIYFHEGIPDIEDGKILVGHIGKHL